MALYDQLNWGLLVLREQEVRYQNLLEMSDAEWETWARDFIKGSKHVRRSIRFVNRIAGMRAMYIPDAMYYSHPSESDSLQVDMNLLRDMVDEPEKYGDDIAEALELEQQLLQTRKAWRVHYMWVRKEHEEYDAPATVIQTAYKQHKLNQKNAAATKIQAVWRGFETRCSQRWTDCARCLCHRVSSWMIGGPEAVCEDCYNEVRYGCTVMEEEECAFECSEPEEESEPEPEEEPRHSRMTCVYCQYRTTMAGCSYCATCYRDEKLYKHERIYED